MVWSVLIAAVSCAYILARVSLGSAMVAMIRMIAITIISSIKEKPRVCGRFFFMAVPNYFMTFEPFETWEGFYQPVERQDAPPELRQQVQLQSVGTVGKSLLRLVMDFHEQPVHPDRGRRS